MGWRDEYKQAMIRFLLKQGSPVTRANRSFGWVAEDWEQQSAAVMAALDDPWFDYDAVKIEESTWYEFDSFDSNQASHGIDARVTIDGQEYRFRFSGSMSDVLLGLLDEEG